MFPRREIIKRMAPFARLTELRHDFAPAVVVATIHAVLHIGDNVRTLVQQSGVAIGFPSGLQQRGVKHDSSLLRVGCAGHRLGATADLHGTSQAPCYAPVVTAYPRQTRVEIPSPDDFLYRSKLTTCAPGSPAESVPGSDIGVLVTTTGDI